MLVMRLCKWLPSDPRRPRVSPEALEANLPDGESTAILAGVEARGLSIRGVQFAISRLARLSGPIVHVHRSDCARC